MRTGRWQPHRAGLFNFWYYDDEEYHFADGKLLLRGSNGSGKSVTMQSLVPVLLDGRKSPDRLDPFGSRARKMEDYLLGEKDVVERDERTGYLYLEYKRVDSEQYIATGIGLRAKRHSNLDFWGFVLTDNRRIGHDFFLYKTEYSPENGEELKIPLTRRELENRIDQGGKVVRGQKEYMDLVNKHVFGFESLEAYEELIKLLIQLRSPKLSKDYRPTVIYDILNESLPALSDDELRPLSDTIENMDQTKQHLDQLLRDRESLRRLNSQYDRYNQYVLAEKANGYIKAEQKQRQLGKKKEEAIQELERVRQQLDQDQHTIAELKREEQVLKDELVEWQQHDVFQAQRDKGKAEQKLSVVQIQLKDKEDTLDKKKSKERELRRNIERTEQSLAEEDKQIQEELSELGYYAEEAQFPMHDVAENEFVQRYRTEYDFILWSKEAQEYEAKIGQTLKILGEHSRKKEKLEEVERELGEKKKELDLKRNEEQKWQRLFEEEKDRFIQSFHQWHKKNTELVLNDEEIQETSRLVMNWFEPYQLEEVRTPVSESYHRHYGQLREQELDALHQLKTKNQEIDEKSKELDELKKKKEEEPKRHADTEKARQQLEERNIPFLPFYSAVEFHEHVSAHVRERIESAVQAMGLLDALIVPQEHLRSIDHSDRVIHPQPQLFAHTLTEYLYPTPVDGIHVSVEDIDNVLRSVLVSETAAGTTEETPDGAVEGKAFIDDQGRYRLDFYMDMPHRKANRFILGKSPDVSFGCR